MIRAAKSACAGISATSLVQCFVQQLERRAREASTKLRVLTYHRIGYPEREEQGDPALISATPEGFRAQMQVLADHYHVVSVEEVLEAVRVGGLLPPRAVLVSFDDAYRDFQQYAWPVLREMGLPVTLFVPTAYPDDEGREFWWDRLARAIRRAGAGEAIEAPCGRFPLATERDRRGAARALKAFVKSRPHDEAMQWIERVCGRLDPEPRRLPPTLGWEALRTLHAEGVALGAHTRTHPLLNRVDDERLEEEVFGAKRDLERQIGSWLPVFAYPAGAVGPRAPDCLRAAGFELAWTTRSGASCLREDDPLQLRRFHVGTATTAPLLRARLASA